MYLRAIIASWAALMACTAASAQTTLRVQPIRVRVDAPSQATAISLQNTGTSPVSLQLRVFEWTQSGDGEVIRPTTDVVVSPPAVTIPGNETYTVRIARTAGAVASGERAYRLWIDEIPVTATAGADSVAVDVRLRYDMPLFFGAPGTASDVAWSVARSGGNLVVEAVNRGHGHARVAGLRVGDVVLGRGLVGYILPGATRRWVAPAGTALSPQASNVMLVARVDDVEISQNLAITSR